MDPSTMAFLEQQQHRDIMRVMSEMVDQCFSDCIYNFRIRKLDPKEKLCLYQCTDKYFRHASRTGRIMAEQTLLTQPPSVLLPIVGVPLLNYVIEFLASSGISSIYILCCFHVERIIAYIEELRSRAFIGVRLFCLTTKQCRSQGDLLRDSQLSHIFQDDFVLIYGDVISNHKLSPMIQKHLKRREKDPNALITLLLTSNTVDQPVRRVVNHILNQTKENETKMGISNEVNIHETGSSPSKEKDPTPTTNNLLTDPSITSQLVSDSNALRRPLQTNTNADEHDDDLFSLDSSSDFSSSHQSTSNYTSSPQSACPDGKVVIMDEDNQQLMLYEDSGLIISPMTTLGELELDLSLFDNHPHLHLRADLLESGVMICSPNIFSLLEEHFDCKTIAQLVRRLLTDSVQGHSIFAELCAPTHYSCRVRNWRRYRQSTLDVLRRWTYPLVPDDAMLLAPDAAYIDRRPGYYAQPSLHLAQTTHIGEDCALGTATHIGAYSRIECTIIGKHCRIGSNVHLNGCLIWDHVTIGDECRLQDCIISNNTIIGNHVTIDPGCIIGLYVEIPSNTHLPRLTKLMQPDSHNNLLASHLDENSRQLHSKEEEDADRDEEEGEDKTKKGDECSIDAQDLPSLTHEETFDMTLYSNTNLYSPMPLQEFFIGWETYLDIIDACQIPTPWSNYLHADLDPCDGLEQEISNLPSQSLSNSQLSITTDREQFSIEIGETIKRTIDSTMLLDTVVLEVNALKYAYDKNSLDCATSIFHFIADMALESFHKDNMESTLSIHLMPLLLHLSPLLCQFLAIFEDQIEFIFQLEEVGDHHPEFSNIFEGLLHKLYDRNVLIEEAIFGWEKECHNATTEEKKYCTKAKNFLNWLRSSEEEDEED